MFINPLVEYAGGYELSYTNTAVRVQYRSARGVAYRIGNGGIRGMRSILMRGTAEAV